MRITLFGKITFTILTVLITILIYNLMVDFGARVQDSIIYLVPLILGWFWLLIGQIAIYLMIWGEN